MWPDFWPVMPESEREQWDYVPLESVGPLQFGASPAEVVAAMRESGFTCGAVSKLRDFGSFPQLRQDFHRPDALHWQRSVVTYYIDSTLTCVVVSALAGPQVTWDGMRLIGRVPSVLRDELAAYLEDRELEIRFMPGGDIGADTLGVIPDWQRAGDAVLTRGVFGRRHFWGNTLHDCIPGEVWSVH